MKSHLMPARILVIAIFSISSFSFSKKSIDNRAKVKTCDVVMELKHSWSGTISALTWRDNDESYTAANLSFGAFFSSTFDATSDITVFVKLPSNHPAGSMLILNADTGQPIYCVNFTTDQIYTHTFQVQCGVIYTVNFQNSPC